MKIQLSSHGKSEILSGKVVADLYIDCRGIRNPYRNPDLGSLTGDSPLMQQWVRDKNGPYVEAALTMILSALDTAPTRNSFRFAPDKPFRVAFFCLGGVHRSRSMKHVVGTELSKVLATRGIHEVEVI